MVRFHFLSGVIFASNYLKQERPLKVIIDKNSAFEQLEISATHPSGVSYGGLKLFPYWDRLRGDTRFEKLLARLKPKTT